MRLRRSRTKGHVSPCRRLLFEALERRDLLAVMRVVDWNTLNGPNTETSDDFNTILAAIGNETIQGNTKRIDILALQETDPPDPGGDPIGSIGEVETILDAIYPSTNYSFAVSPVDNGGDSTGFVYDTSTVSLVESVQVPGSLTHTVMRGKFRPTATLGESDFYVYSVHLKSGTTGADATARGTEASVLRANADALGEGANVLFVGDFNMKDSFEAAYTNLVASGAGQVQDVADAPGDWFDNPAFKSLHSQDPRTTMDDRFDIQFASGEFFDGVGLEYVGNSFHVFGNNGTHTFDMPITTGTGASPTVLAALAAASDHLPVVADYELIVSTPKVRITETLGGTKVVEGGFYDTYHVVLDTVPTANVTVTVTPNSQVDVGNGAGVAKALTFTPANALIPQTVVVNAANDVVSEGDHAGLITHTSASADAAYNGLSIAGVNVSIVDNDAPKIVINEIDADQTSIDTMEFIELYDGGVGNASLTGKIIVLFNGNLANDPSYLTIDLAGKSTDASGFFVLGNAGVPGVDLVFSGNTLQNGADAVALYAAAAASFPNGTSPTTTGLLDAIVYDTGQPDDAGLLVLLDNSQETQPQVNENANAGTSGETQSLSRVPDGGQQRITNGYVAQTPTPGTFNSAQPAGALFLQSGSRVDVEEGGASDSYQIALVSIPTANVQITVDPDGQTDLGAGAGVPIVLTFTPANALIPQLVTVTAVDDLAVDGVHASVITHTASSADSKYNGVPIGNVVANVLDNDLAAPPSIVISEVMYNPASDESSPGVGEWFEIVNNGTSSVDLGGWLFDDEDATNWGAVPPGTILNPKQIAVFFDTDFTTAATFRSEWSVPASALVVGISWGNLANTPSPGNEVLKLLNNVNVQMDFVNYDDTSPWPSNSDGPSIYLKSLSLDNNSGANWARSTSGAAGALSPSGPTFSTSDVGSPGRFFLAGDYNLNGVVDGADYVVWRDTLGSSDPRADGSGPVTGVPNGVVDQFDYTFWRANFGGVGVPNGGSGSGADVSTLVAATALSEPNDLIVLSEPKTAATSGASAVDVAVIELSLAPANKMVAVKSRALSGLTSSSSVAESANLLLLADRVSPLTPRRDEYDDAPAGSLDERFCDVDDHFASLADGKLGENVPVAGPLRGPGRRA